ncbi:MAG: heme-copper oxidase subunit III [Chloroflexi bacterium]|nr:heme-copper oxidase subunit III [Chloroflexota bacterium]
MGSQTSALKDHFRAGGELGINHIKLGMWFFIASEVMFFGGLIATFLNFKINSPTLEGELLDVTLVGINTFILLGSSFAVVLGLDAIRQDKPRQLAFYLGITIVLGVIFLSGQVFEFRSLAAEGLTLTSSVFGSSFFTMTSFHGLHVLIGVLWASRNFIKTLRGGYSSSTSIGIELFGIYWHFVDIVWIILFTVIYLI